METTSPTEEQAHEVHEPVLLAEVLEWLKPSEGMVIVDCTLGMGGHSEALLEAGPAIKVIGLDRDAESLDLARRRLQKYGERFLGIHAAFEDLSSTLAELGVGPVDGILADLGISSFQLEVGARGFSFQKDEPLDMRMDKSSGSTAADLINNLGEQELADLIFEKGEEPGARRIARAIVRERGARRIESTKLLSEIVVRALRKPGRWRIHPATRTFQALRIAVNGELERLDEFISSAISALRSRGRLMMISFHSLEDRIVKTAYRRESGRCVCSGRDARPAPQAASPDDDPLVCLRCGASKRVEVLTRKPIRPLEEEIARNPRSRSARLRVCERT